MQLVGRNTADNPIGCQRNPVIHSSSIVWLAVLPASWLLGVYRRNYGHLKCLHTLFKLWWFAKLLNSLFNQMNRVASSLSRSGNDVWLNLSSFAWVSLNSTSIRLTMLVPTDDDESQHRPDQTDWPFAEGEIERERVRAPWNPITLSPFSRWLDLFKFTRKCPRFSLLNARAGASKGWPNWAANFKWLSFLAGCGKVHLRRSKSRLEGGLFCRVGANLEICFYIYTWKWKLLKDSLLKI